MPLVDSMRGDVTRTRLPIELIAQPSNLPPVGWMNKSVRPLPTWGAKQMHAGPWYPLYLQVQMNPKFLALEVVEDWQLQVCDGYLLKVPEVGFEKRNKRNRIVVYRLSSRSS